MRTVPGVSLRYTSLDPRLLSLTPLASPKRAMKVGGLEVDGTPQEGGNHGETQMGLPQRNARIAKNKENALRARPHPGLLHKSPRQKCSRGGAERKWRRYLALPGHPFNLPSFASMAGGRR